MKNSLSELKELARLCRGDILKMTSVASSGHPGGSMSSIELYLSVFNRANIDPKNPFDEKRDKTVVSHGHTSPGVYSSLARLGFFAIDDVISGFRHPGSIFEGHVTRGIPGIEWSTGNLGQGLSAGVGFALAAKMKNEDSKVYVFSSDGESPKGQISEARRTAKKENLNNLIVLVDYNDIQISGRARDVLPVNIKEEYKSAGWNVLEIDGHNLIQINEALEIAENNKMGPTVIIASTIIGKGVSFMKNRHEYHGSPLSDDELDKALKELNIENDIEKYRKMRENLDLTKTKVSYPNIKLDVEKGKPRIYPKDKKIDNRSAFGNALADLAKENKNKFPIAALDCDLFPSVKLAAFKEVNPEGYIQIGIQEHNAATIAGALSTSGVLTFFADFGVFGLDEPFNQQRLNDINHTNLKTAITHSGTDVGEDGKTHQEVNYIGLTRSLYNTKLIVPNDPNQTDKVVRYAASTDGNIIITMGRSKLDIILDENGDIFYGENYEFNYGDIDVLRNGEDITIITYGTYTNNAVKTADNLRKENININVIGVPTPLDYDEEKILPFLKDKIIITLEDHNLENGIANELSKTIVKNNVSVKDFINLGYKDYAASGSSKLIQKQNSLDVDSLTKMIKELY
ncbi:transketolase [Geotoga petraea]|uniref:Transketolase n=1 Tax=Geotoga petraea TaxID=28234 RepID=A0A1G6JVR3_9BACT|nr:transketolase [Geotoga petraea]MDK2945684.1 transketolase [Geotoga sp.]TGG88336.1 transketolase [Geotoga petraea]SDC22803.1 transketolase [Geotoga petraea]